MRIKIMAVSTMAVALLGLGVLVGGILGTGGAFAQTPTATATPAPNKDATPKSTVTAKLTKEQAEQAALTASPGNTIDHTALISQDGIPVYDVDFTNGGGVLVNGDTGAIIQIEAAGTDVHGPRGGGRDHGPGGPGGQDQAALLAQAKITKEQAEQAALTASPGNTIDHSRLGKDADGTIFWDVDFTNDGGVIINAQTGAVIKVEAAGTDVHGPRGGDKPGATGTPTP